jgi:hypothetical protein
LCRKTLLSLLKSILQGYCFLLLLSAKTYPIRKKKGLISDFGVQPFLVIFELPHLKVNHEQKYTFLRTADIWPVYKVLKQGQDSEKSQKKRVDVLTDVFTSTRLMFIYELGNGD